MVLLRLDPRYPLVWRSPAALQIGARPLVVLEEVTAAEERMLGALAKGVPAESLPVHGRCTPHEAAVLVARLAPVLAGAPTRAALPVTTVRARDPQSKRLGELARDLGLLGEVGAVPPSANSPEAGIAVGTYAIPPFVYRDWLSRGIPHVGILLGETTIEVSHVVVGGQTPCLRCADLHRRDADPCWPAVAAQLIDQPAAAADDQLSRVAALTAAVRRLRAAVAGAPNGRSLSALATEEPQPWIRLTVGGAAAFVDAPAHPECGCRVDLQLENAAVA